MAQAPNLRSRLIGTGGVKRKLTTVLAVDVVGYSRLVAENDEAAIRRLLRYREVMEALILRHDGRPFGAAGDGLMAEFPSAVEAVRCGIEIQEEVLALNREAPAGEAMQLRIGINVGEAIAEVDNLYGDAVNVAARLEGIADPGGIFISASAYEQIKRKVSADIEPVGLRNLKNLPEPVAVFRVRTIEGAPARAAATASGSTRRWKVRAAAAAAATLAVAGAIVAWVGVVQPALRVETFAAEAAYPVPKEPSIVVLPFVNGSGNSAQEHLSDGLSEDITTDLTRLSGLFVVGRDAAFSYKGRAVQAQYVGRELGVRYVLQGSVRHSDNMVRVSAYLVDAATGRTVWADRQDRVLDDVFALQDDIARNVVKSLELNLREGQREEPRKQYAQYFAAYDTFLKGRQLLGQPSKRNLLAARTLFEETVKLDPNFAGGYAGISLTYSHAVRHRLSDSPVADIREASRYGKIALGKDDRYGMALLAMSNAYLLERKQDEAVALADAAHNAYPVDANINAVLGFMLTFAGRAKEALPYIDKALDLNRLDAFNAPFYFFKMLAAYTDGQYGLAHDAYRKYRELEARTEHGPREARIECQRNCLAYAAAIKLRLLKAPGLQKDEHDLLAKETKDIAARLTRDDPEFLGGLWTWKSLFKDPEHGQRVEDDLKAALGL